MTGWTTKRNNNFSKTEFLWKLGNKFGYDIEVCHSWTDNKGNKFFSKWKSLLWLMQFEHDEYIKELGMTRKEFIEKASHRTVLDMELLLDFDERGSFDSIKQRAKNICENLKNQKIEYTIYFSGSKSYHISILFPFLKKFNKYKLTIKKKTFIEWLGGDGLKASSRNMIALEGEPHWKTGVIKQEVHL